MEYLDKINKDFRGKIFEGIRVVGEDKVNPDRLIFDFSDEFSFSITGKAIKTSIQIDSVMETS